MSLVPTGNATIRVTPLDEAGRPRDDAAPASFSGHVEIEPDTWYRLEGYFDRHTGTGVDASFTRLEGGSLDIGIIPNLPIAPIRSTPPPTVEEQARIDANLEMLHDLAGWPARKLCTTVSCPPLTATTPAATPTTRGGIRYYTPPVLFPDGVDEIVIRDESHISGYPTLPTGLYSSTPDVVGRTPTIFTESFLDELADWTPAPAPALISSTPTPTPTPADMTRDFTRDMEQRLLDKIRGRTRG